MAEQGLLRQFWRARVAIVVLFVLSGIAAAALSPAVQKGVVWLKTQVQSAGTVSGEDASRASRFQTRDESLRTLQLLSSSTTNPDVNQQDTSATEYLARKILSLGMTGADVSALVKTLVASQNADGGFGATAGSTSTPLDSAWALAALARQQAVYATNVSSLSTYLYGQIQSDGGVAGFSPSARVQATSVMLLGLESLAPDLQASNALQKLSVWLAQQQAADGSWNEDLYLTAYSLSALIPVSADATMQQLAAGFLQSKQAADGSWNDDPFLTAVIIRALGQTTAVAVSGNTATGQVVAGATGQALANVAVSADGTTITTTTDSQGRFSLTGLPNGIQTLHFSLSGFQNGTLTLSAPILGAVQVGNVMLTPVSGTVTISGTVTDPYAATFAYGNTLVAGATVSVTGTSLTTQTDSNGNYQLTNVPSSSPITVSVSAAGYLPASMTANLAGVGLFNYSPQLTRQGQTPSAGNATVTGQVLQQGSYSVITGGAAPLANVQVLANQQVMATTDANGNYSLSLPPGVSTLTYQIAGYTTVSQPVSVNASTSMALPPVYMSATQGTTSISGGVYTCSQQYTGTGYQTTCNYIANATVSVSQAPSVTTNAQGQYAVLGLPGTQFDVRVSAPGYNSQDFQVQLAQPQAIVHDFSLTPQGQQSGAQAVQIGAITATPASVPLSTNVVFTTTYQNTGTSAVTINPSLNLLNAGGSIVSEAIPYANIGDAFSLNTITLAPGASQVVNFAWNSAHFAVGTYTAIAHATVAGTKTTTNPLGTALAANQGQVTITPQTQFTGSVTATPPVQQASDTPTPIQVTAFIQNTGNVATGTHTITAQFVDPTQLDPTKQVVATLTAALPALGLQQFANLNFGSWSAPVAGSYTLNLINDDNSSLGITSQVYVGKSVSGAFTVTPSLVPTGTQVTQGQINLQGASATSALLSDKAAASVLAALQRAVPYNDTTASQWVNAKGCASCHIASTAIFGGELSNKFAPRNVTARNYLLAAIKTEEQSDGSYYGYVANPITETALNEWGMTPWQNTPDVLSDLVKSANYMVAHQGANGAWAWDYNNTAWFYDSYSINALMTYNLSNLLQLLSANPQLPIHTFPAMSSWNNGALYGFYNGSTMALTTDENGVIYTELVDNNYISHIARLNTDGSYQYLVSLPQGVQASCFRVYKGTIYTAYSNGNLYNGSGIYAYDFNGNLLPQHFVGDYGPFAVDASGYVYAINYAAYNWPMVKLDPGTGSVIQTYTSPDSPYFRTIAATKDGQVYFGSPSGLGKVQPDGTLQMVYQSAGLDIRDLSFDNAGNPLMQAALTAQNGYPTTAWLRLNANGLITRLASGNYYSLVQLPDGGYLTTDYQSVWPAHTYYWGMFFHRITEPAYSATDMAGFVTNYNNSLQKAWTYWQNNLPAATDADNLHYGFALMALANLANYFDATNQASAATQARALMSPLVATLRGRQHTDGGWNDPNMVTSTGVVSVPNSDPLITAIIGYGLVAAQVPASDPMIASAVGYEIGKNMQGGDGSWTSAIMSTKVAATTWVSIFLPVTLNQVANINADLYLTFPNNVQFSIPSLAPTDSTGNADGSVLYHWNFANLHTDGANLNFNLTLPNLVTNEQRPVASDAHLTFTNSFTNSVVTAPLTIPVVTASDGLAFAVSTDHASYGANSPVAISSQVSNTGASVQGGSVHFVVFAANGTQIADLGSQPFAGLAPAGADPLSASWNTGLLLPNAYYVQATLLDGSNNVVSTAKTNFTITASSATGSLVGAAVTTDKGGYGPYDTVQLTDQVSNLTSNALAGNLTLNTQITGPGGQVVWTHQDSLQQLVAGGIKDFGNSIPVANGPAGTYQIALTVTDSSGATQASANGSYTVQSSAITGAGLSAALNLSALTLSGHSLITSDTLTLNTTLSNAGNAALSNLPVTTLLLDAKSGNVVTQWQDTVSSLAAGGSANVSHTWPSQGASGQSFIVVVQSGLTGSKALAQQTVTLVKPQVSLALSTDKAAYDINTAATLTSTITSATPIPLAGLSLSEQILKPDGSTVLWQNSVPNLSVATAGTLNHADAVALGVATPGNYQAIVKLLDANGGVLAQATTGFQMISTATDGAGMAGNLSGLANLTAGATATIGYTVSDQGNAAVSNVPAQIVITNPATGVVVARLPQTIASLAMGASLNGQVGWSSMGVVSGTTLQATLQVQFGGNWQTLAQQSFTLTKPVVSSTLSGVTPGGYAYNGTVTVTEQAQNQSVVNFNPATVTWTLADANANVVTTSTAPVVAPANSTTPVTFSYTFTQAPPGSYTLSMVFTGNGETLSQAQTPLVVQSTAQTGAGITGTLNGFTGITAGATVNIGFNLADVGNASVSNLPLQVVITNIATQVVVATLPTSVAQLAMNGSQGGQITWATGNLTPSTPLSASLQMQVGGSWITLAQQPVTLLLPVVNTAFSGVVPAGYAYNDSVVVTANIQNQSVVSFTPGAVVWTLNSANGTVLTTNTVTPAPNLPANTATPVPFTYTFNTAAPGSYTLTAAVSGNGMNLSLAQTTLTVQSSAQTGAGLGASLSVSPTISATTPYVGQTVVLGESLSNAGNAAYTNLPVTMTVSQGTNTIQTWTDTVANLAMAGSQSLAHNWSPTATGSYQLQVTANVAGKNLVLATQAVTIQPPPIKLDVQTKWGGVPRVLVYLGSGDQDAHEQQCQVGSQKGNCLAPRVSAVQSTLNALGVQYLIVTTQDDFIRALRSGAYNNEWLLGVVNGLPDAVVDELSEAVNRGDSLLVDDAIQAWNNHRLYALAGVTFRGHLDYSSAPPVTFGSPVFGSGMSAYNPLAISTGSVNRPLYFLPTTAQSTATYNGAPTRVDQDGDPATGSVSGAYPAALSGQYGQGHTLTFAFDLVGSLLPANGGAAWQELLHESLGALVSTADANPAAVIPGAYVHASVIITNQGNASDFTATVQLPAGATLVGTSPAATVNSDGSLSIPVHLDVNAVQTIGIDFRAPTTAGNYTLTTRIRAAGQPSDYGQYPQSFGVEASSQRQSEVRADLVTVTNTCTQASCGNQGKVNDLLRTFDSATQYDSTGNLADAISTLVGTSDDLNALSGSNAATARQALDLLLQDWEAQWWRSPCGSATGTIQGSCAP